MSICATVGIPVITQLPSCIHDGFVGFTGLRGVDKEFLYYTLKQLEPAFRGLGQTGSQSNLNSDLVRNCPVALPPLQEQRAIARALADCDELLGSLERMVTKQRDVKQAAMQRLLTGEQHLPAFDGAWHLRTFGETFDILGNASNARADLSTYGDVGYVHYGDVHKSSAAFLDCDDPALPTIERAKVAGTTRAMDGDLVMADASEDYAGVGKAVELRNPRGRPVVAGLHTFLMRPDRDLLARGFVGYLQFLPNVKAALERAATGISVYGISKSAVRSVEFMAPPVEEQRAIAAVLSDMDAELAALDRRLAKIRAVKQAMMQDLLTGRRRLVPSA